MIPRASHTRLRRSLVFAAFVVAYTGCKPHKPVPWSRGSCLIGEYVNDDDNRTWCVYDGAWWWCASDPMNGFYCRRIAVATPPPVPAEAR